MSTFLSLSVTLILIVIYLFSGKRQQPQTSVEEQEYDPMEDFPKELRELLGQTVRPNRVEPQRMHPDSQEDIIAEEERISNNKTKPRAVEPTHPKTEVKTAENNPLTGDFDLRKAVVWSEILNPKFKEEE